MLTTAAHLALLEDRDLRQRVQKLALLGLDIDGVLTDGTLYYAADGESLKAFNSLDGHGLKMLQAASIQVAIISGRSSPMVAKRCQDLGITHVYLGVEDKLQALNALQEKTGISPEHMAFMGDDLPDLPVLQCVGFATAPANAHADILSSVHWQSINSGGQGAVRSLCDLILAARLIPS